MRKYIAAAIAVLLLLGGCAVSPAEESTGPASPPPETQSAPTGTLPRETAPTETLPRETAPTETQAHSPLYLCGLSQDIAVLYFREVCLDAEIVNSGDPGKLQKWAEPIVYRIHGEPVREDLALIEAFFRQLCAIEGFPGCREAAPEEDAAMNIHFCSRGEMVDILGPWSERCDGGVTFWYEADRIYSATVCIRTDLHQQLRNSVVLEELYNALGPIQDTALREDSVIYAGFSMPQEMTREDLLILQLLYHPDMKPGMTAAECDAAIRQLYY